MKCTSKLLSLSLVLHLKLESVRCSVFYNVVAMGCFQIFCGQAVLLTLFNVSLFENLAANY